MRFWELFLGFDPNRENTFPGQQVGEEVELMTVFHWIKLVPFFLEVAVLLTGLFVLNFYSDFFVNVTPFTKLVINSIALALVIHMFCFRLYNYFLKVIIITNYRLIDIRHSVFLRREQEDIAMTNVQDCHFQQRGIFPRIFKYGDLIIMGTSSDIKYTFHSVPRVAKIHNLINEIQQKSIRRPIGLGIGATMPRAVREPLPKE